jgi:hypothetical protein
VDDRDVASITESVIVEHGLSFAVLSVVRGMSGWDIRVREQRGGAVVPISIPGGRPIDIRVAIHEQLDALFNR